MARLTMIIFSMASTALMGAFIVAALVLGHVTLQAILIAAAAGFVLALPVSVVVARQIAG